MITIKTTEALQAFCDHAKKYPFVTVDTEFLRERTYYSKLCLVQLAVTGDNEEDAVLLDPLAKDIDLAPLYELFLNEDVVKVFHAARQDLEIFYIQGGVIPTTPKWRQWCAGLANKLVMKPWCVKLPSKALIKHHVSPIGRAVH